MLADLTPAYLEPASGYHYAVVTASCLGCVCIIASTISLRVLTMAIDTLACIVSLRVSATSA